MLGTRGCRLGILYPEIYEMQVRAIVGAALAVRERTGTQPERRDHDPARRLRARAGADARARRSHRRARRSASRRRADRLHGRDDDRAAARVPGRGPDRRARRLLQLRHQRPHADGARVLARRRREAASSSATSSRGSSTAARSRRSTCRAWARSCAWRPSRAARRSPDLKLGICGEHGGDPDSIRFFDEVGLDYVSCSPVPRPDRARRRGAGRARATARAPQLRVAVVAEYYPRPEPSRPRASGRTARRWRCATQGVEVRVLALERPLPPLRGGARPAADRTTAGRCATGRSAFAQPAPTRCWTGSRCATCASSRLRGRWSYGELGPLGGAAAAAARSTDWRLLATRTSSTPTTPCPPGDAALRWIAPRERTCRWSCRCTAATSPTRRRAASAGREAVARDAARRPTR